MTAAALGLGVSGCAGAASTSVSAPTVATTLVDQSELSCALPGVQFPNCGHTPVDAGDRGGSLQYVLWAALMTGLTVVFTVVFRSAKRTERNRAVEAGERNWS